MTTPTPSTETLATFAATLRFDAIPTPVMRRTEDLLLDWVGSCLAGKDARAVEILAAFMESTGPRTRPSTGPSEIPIHPRTSNPLMAPMANAPAAPLPTQPDLSIGSDFRPAPAVFSPPRPSRFGPEGRVPLGRPTSPPGAQASAGPARYSRKCSTPNTTAARTTPWLTPR